MNARPLVIQTVLALAALAPALSGQAVASLSPAPRLQFFDNAGRPLAGGCIQTFAAGSTTPLNSYSNAAGTANSNPVILDAYGRADIWLGAGVAYKITVRAKTTGCAGGGGAVMYTADGVIDQGFGLVRALQLGTLTLGLRGLPVTSLPGGTGIGNAVLSATVDGLYVSVNGAAPALIGSGGTGGSGTPALPINSVQYNNSGAFAGSPNFTWDRINNVLAICPPPALGCTANSGVDAPTFSATATGNTPAFENGPGTFHIDGNGSGYFQNLSVTATFNSLATGPTAAVQQANGTFKITGAGDAGFQSVGIGLHATPTTGLSGGVNVGSATLSATTAGLYLSLNGAAPVLVGGGGGSGTPGAPVNSIQFNNAGAFAGNANMTFDSAAFVLTVCPPPATGCTATSGIQAPAFSSSNTAGNSTAFTNQTGTFRVYGSGDGLFQTLSVTSTFNSLATGPTSAVQQVNGTFKISGAGDAGFQSVGIGLRATALTGTGGGTGVGNAMLSATTAGLYLSLNGAAPVLVGGGGGAGTPGAPATSIQFNNAGAFAGNANMTFDSTNFVLSVCPPPATGCTATSGIQAPAFSSSATGTNSAFVAGQGAAVIQASGRATFQDVVVNSTFNSVATGAVKVIQQANGTFSISGAGDAAFQSVAVGAGGWGINNAGLLTVSSCIGCVGAAAGANTQVQFNNGGIFGASANMTWNGNALTIGGAAGTGVIANTFTANATGAFGFQLANNNWSVDNTGRSSQIGPINISGGAAGAAINILGDAGTFRVMNYYTGSSTIRWQSGVDGVTETGGNTGSRYQLTRYADTGAGIDQPFYINRSDGVVHMPDGLVTGGTFGLTAAGALTVASCTGCSGAPGGVTNSLQFNNGAGAFGGTANLTWNGGTNILTIGGSAGGLNAYQISSYATGATTAFNVGAFVVSGAGDVTARNLTVSSCTGCGGGGAPGGSNTQLQWNNGGAFAGSAALTWNNASSVLNATTFQSQGTYNCNVSGATACIGTNSGTFSINGLGNFLGQSIATGANNGTTATVGQGAVINKSGSTIAMYTYDANGVCSLGTGNTAPGVLCSSDEKQKKNVATITDGVQALMTLRPVKYNWIGNGAPGVGFIAQEVRRTMPQLVDTVPGNADMLMLSESGMIPYLVRAVQQLEGELTTLRARIK